MNIAKDFMDKMSLAKKFLLFMGFQKRFPAILRKAVEASFHGFNEKPNEKMLEEICNEVAESYLLDILDEVSALYASVYEKKTIKKLVKFAKSKEGQKYFAGYQDLNEGLGNSSNKWVVVMAKEVLTRYEKCRLKKKAEEGVCYRDFLPPFEI